MIKYNRFILCLVVTAVSLVFTATTFSGAFKTIATSAVELWNSILAYIGYFFLSQPPTQNPIAPPTGEIPNVLPTNPSEFGPNISQFFRLIFSGQNFAYYLMTINILLVIFFMVLPFFLIGFYLIKRYIKYALSKHNNRYNQDTTVLKGVKRLCCVQRPICVLSSLVNISCVLCAIDFNQTRQPQSIRNNRRVCACSADNITLSKFFFLW